MYVYICIYIYVCLYVRIYICIYIIYLCVYIGKCSAVVRVCRLGNDLSRVTFWCPACQPSHAVAGVRGLGASQAAHRVGAVHGGGGGGVVARGGGAGFDGGRGGGVGAGQDVGRERSNQGAAVCDLHPLHTAAPGLDLSMTCTPNTKVTPALPGDSSKVCSANMEFAGLTEAQRKRILENREEALRRQKICRQQQSQAATSSLPTSSLPTSSLSTSSLPTSSLQPQPVTPSHVTLQSSSLHTSMVGAGAACVAGGGRGWGAGGTGGKGRGGGGEGGGGRGEVKCSAAKLLAAAAKPLAGGVTNVPVPKCPTHARECRIKRVHKQGANKGRLFFSCNVPSCKFFQWGDVWFPKCSSHPQRPSVLRCAQRERESARAREREFIRIDTP